MTNVQDPAISAATVAKCRQSSINGQEMSHRSYRRQDRRRAGQAGQSPMTILEQLPALVVLQRLPVPTLALGQDSSILFANAAFADMLGHPLEELLTLKFYQVFHTLRVDESDAVFLIRAYANQLVELAHSDGSIVRALMSKSALRRGDDPVAITTFQDLTEKLWDDGVNQP
jgi:PAS domain S-box-containing protein